MGEREFLLTRSFSRIQLERFLEKAEETRDRKATPNCEQSWEIER